ncbi:hypothetical protein LTSEMIS_5653, partial [Salmonella enterica subsp. enterica serovar Mississippi str. A4-633]
YIVGNLPDLDLALQCGALLGACHGKTPVLIHIGIAIGP